MCMYHLTRMWFVVVVATAAFFYLVGRWHGRRALTRQLRGGRS